MEPGYLIGSRVKTFRGTARGWIRVSSAKRVRTAEDQITSASGGNQKETQIVLCIYYRYVVAKIYGSALMKHSFY